MDRTTRGWLLGTAAALTLASAAQAAEPAPGVLEEVLVTAQRRTESLQDVPVAVSVIGRDQITGSGISSVSALAKQMPGVYLENTGSSRPKMYIRGMGTEAFDAGSDPAVAVFVDDIYISRFQGVDLDLFDVERIEVLKGPQGALFGRNASAGAISVVSRRPGSERGGEVELTIGEDDLRYARAAVDLPLMDGKVRTRLSFGAKQRDGYTRDLISHAKDNNEDRWGVRGQVEFSPAEDLEVRVAVDYSEADEAMWAAENINNSIYLLSPAVSPAPFLRTPGKYDDRYSRDGYQQRETAGVALHLDWTLGPGILSSRSAYRRYELLELQDVDATLAESVDRGAHEEAVSLSQELRYTADLGERWSVLAGLYLQDEDIDRRDDVFLGRHNIFAGGRAFQIRDLWSVDTFARAVFAKLDYHVTPELTVSLGARYGKDTKTLERNDTNDGRPTPLMPAPYAVRAKNSWTSFDPSAIVSYKPSARLHLYASYREGSKAGGYQSAPQANATTGGRAFAPEQVSSYEIGLKSLLLDGRLRFEAAVFKSKYRDLQFLTVTGPATSPFVVTDNAGQAKAEGLEVNINFAPVPWLRLNGGASLLDGTFERYVDGGGVSRAGKRLLRAPEQTLFASAEVRKSLGDYDLALGVDYYYQDLVYFTPANVAAYSQPGFDLLNANLTLRSSDRDWRVTVWGKNLSNTVYSQGIIAFPGGAGISSIGPPRMFGVTLGASF